MERLSLPGTWVFKLLLPVFSTGLLALVLASRTFNSVQSAVVEVLLSAAFLASLWWLGFPLKLVWLDGDHLVVSNYLRDTRVALDQVVGVKRNWDGWRTVTITLASSTPFGRKIRFFPDFYSEAAERLRDAVRHSGGSA